ncbi:MAG: uroporphyrinogen decarboxylase family protein [Candidatus Helarchaeota archaeon]
MKPVDRVRAAIHFSNPDPIPVFNITVLFNLIFRNDVYPMNVMPPKTWQPGWADDEVGLFPHFDLPLGWKWQKPDWVNLPDYRNWQNQVREEIDEWGCIWNQPGERKTMGHPGRPSLPEWSHLEEYIERYFLDPDDKRRYALGLRFSRIFGRRKYRMISIGSGPFTIAHRMRGFSQFLIDLRRHPNEVKRLLEAITDRLVRFIHNYVKFGANPHGVLMIEDLGTQYRPFMSPALFKQFFEAPYRRIIDVTHEFRGEYHQHCCGKIDELIPLLMDWGLDALEFDSPRMTGYPALRPFRGKLMFWGCVNIQSIYVHGSPAEVEREVWHMVRNLGTPEGGFGAYFYSQYKDINVSPANIKAFWKGLKKYGRYSKIPRIWWKAPVIDQWIDDEVPPLPS